jgi:hypothetical protein
LGWQDTSWFCSWRAWAPADPRFRYIEHHPDGALKQILLVVFEGCKTARTNLESGVGGWGNLLYHAVAKGADCAAGFLASVKHEMAPIWAGAFWYALCAEGKTLSEAREAAAREVDKEWERLEGEGFHGYWSLDFWPAGAWDTAICPARFGQ